MTKEDAVAIVSEIRSDYNFFNTREEPEYRALSMAIEALKATQWIPCSERLPSAEHNLEGFLVTSKLPNYLEDDVDVFFEVYYNGQFGSHWDGEQLGHVDDGVIAWMECPSPYKGES